MKEEREKRETEIKEFEIPAERFNFLIETLPILEAFGKAGVELTPDEIRKKVPYITGLKTEKREDIHQLLSELSGKKKTGHFFNREEAPLKAPEKKGGKYRLQPRRYRPRLGVFNILKKREDYIGDCYLEINYNGIYLETPKKLSTSGQALHKMAAQILYSRFDTSSSVIIEGKSILEIGEDVCRFSREDLMQQIIDTQIVTWPLLSSNKKPEIKFNGKDAEECNLKICEGEHVPIESGLSVKFFEVRLPISSINRIKIQNEGKLPICKKKGKRLATCLLLTMAGKTEIEILLDNRVLKDIELLKNCEVMSDFEKMRSPLFDRRGSPEYKRDTTVAKNYEFKKEDRGETQKYTLRLTYEDFKNESQLFRSLREYGCLIRIHFVLKGRKIPSSFQILSKSICGPNCKLTTS